MIPRPIAHVDGRQRNVVQHRQVGEQVELLEHHSHLAPDLLNIADIVRQFGPVHDDAPLLVLFQAIDTANKGGLARPGRADDHDHLTRFHSEINSTQGLKLSKPLVQILNDDDFIDKTWRRTFKFHDCHSPKNRFLETGARPSLISNLLLPFSHTQLCLQPAAIGRHYKATREIKNGQKHVQFNTQALPLSVSKNGFLNSKQIKQAHDRDQ